MFVSDAITLDVSFDMAVARLASLKRHGLLARASAQAYARGLTDIFGGSLTCESLLAAAHCRDLRAWGGRMVLALRWEAATVRARFHHPVSPVRTWVRGTAGFRPCNACAAAVILTLNRRGLGPQAARVNSGPEGLRPVQQERFGKMKHIAGTALRAVAIVVLAGAGVAVLAGKDDIRKFRRMRSM